MILLLNLADNIYKINMNMYLIKTFAKLELINNIMEIRGIHNI